MKIMGLPNWLHWTAWFVNNFLMLLISVILMVVMLKVPWYSGTDVTVFTHSNWLLIFIFLMLYAVAMICFCFMITSFFSKANSASTVAGLAWFVLFAPYLFIQNNYTELTLSTKLATSLFSNTAMGYGFQLILMHEGTGKGIQWDNVWEPATQDDDLYFGHLIIFMLLDSAIYLLIAIYVEAVFPGAYGVPKPWYFLFQKSFWCESQVARKKMGKENTDFSEKRQEHNFEQEPELPIGVQIRNLHKVPVPTSYLYPPDNGPPPGVPIPISTLYPPDNEPPPEIPVPTSYLYPPDNEPPPEVPVPTSYLYPPDNEPPPEVPVPISYLYPPDNEPPPEVPVHTSYLYPPDNEPPPEVPVPTSYLYPPDNVPPPEVPIPISTLYPPDNEPPPEVPVPISSLYSPGSRDVL
uniref:ABC-2 type transporter transmembrane domain-containing protein n=1 Tax=Timema tahoe TaxID=61484 RepID=A0A7R9ITT9_9NEOP|nr:unnamed protein product [Timema tahoe]